MNRRLVIVSVALLGLVSAIAGFFAFSQDEAPSTNSPTRILFEQPFKNAAEEPVDLNTYAGQVLVVNFWATWCAPCIHEMPELSALQDELDGQPVQIVGLAVDGFENVRRFENKMRVSYPLLVLGAAGIELARQFGNKAGSLPFTIVVSPRGKIVDRTVGIVSSDHLRQVIELAKQQ